MRDDAERLRDALEAIARVERHVGQDRERLRSDEVLQAAVLRWIVIIGEACAGVSAGLRDRHPEVPWRQIVGMRNQLTHGYFDVDDDLVWATVQRDLPELARNCQAILDEFARPVDRSAQAGDLE